MATERIAIRQDTASNWEAENPTLASGEQGHESDTGRRKIGDGSTAWNSLDYMYGTAATADTTTSATDTTAGRVLKVRDFGVGHTRSSLLGSLEVADIGSSNVDFNGWRVAGDTYTEAMPWGSGRTVLFVAKHESSARHAAIAVRQSPTGQIALVQSNNEGQIDSVVELYHTGNLEVEDSI